MQALILWLFNVVTTKTGGMNTLNLKMTRLTCGDKSGPFVTMAPLQTARTCAWHLQAQVKSYNWQNAMVVKIKCLFPNTLNTLVMTVSIPYCSGSTKSSTCQITLRFPTTESKGRLISRYLSLKRDMKIATMVPGTSFVLLSSTCEPFT